MRGGDRKVAFALRDNYGRVLQSEDDKQEHFLEKTVEEDGMMNLLTFYERTV